MVESPLELKCRNCGRKFWYSGDKSYPDTVNCEECGSEITIIEDA